MLAPSNDPKPKTRRELYGPVVLPTKPAKERSKKIVSKQAKIGIPKVGELRQPNSTLSRKIQEKPCWTWRQKGKSSSKSDQRAIDHNCRI